MAKGIVESALTMNPLEVQDLQEFIIEQVFNRPELLALHGIQTGVTMKEQIVFASQFGKTGIKGDATCGRKTSGAASVLTQKYWEPVGIEDTLIHCNKEIDGLFKAYFTKIQRYRENYEIEGTDLEIFFTILFLESMQNTIWRAAWYGDVDVAAAGAGTAGLVSAGNVKFYDYFDGLWNQIFTGVTATDIAKVTIAENAVVTSKADQLELAAGKSVEYFRAIRDKSDTRLRSQMDAKMYVSGEIFRNYTDYLVDKGAVYDINIMQDGLQSVKWDKYEVVNMETVWDTDSREDFVNNTTDNVYYLPHRIAFTVPANIPIGTLNSADFDELEQWYDRDNRENKMSYGFSLGSKVLEESMITVAY